MSNIYEQKAKKYKYKYLKLKNVYISDGGGGIFSKRKLTITEQLAEQLSEQLTEQIVKQLTKKQKIINSTDYLFEFIGQGSFGCIISPPFQFNTHNIKNICYPPNPNKTISDDIFKSKDYIGKLLSYVNNVFTKEYEQFIYLNNIDSESKHRSKLIFAAYMTKEELTNQLVQIKNVEESNLKELSQELSQELSHELSKELSYELLKELSQELEQELELELPQELQKELPQVLVKILTEEHIQEYMNKLALVLSQANTPAQQLYYCLKEKKLISNPFRDDENSENYGYIITTRVGKSFKHYNLDDFDNDKIIKILENLKESIEDLIIKLYNDDSIHGDIKFENMTLDDDNKVYFIDFGLMQKYKDVENIITQNYQYPDILNIFFNIKNDIDDRTINKTQLIKLLNNSKYQKENSIQSKLLKSIDYSYFFRSIDYSYFFRSIDDEEHDLEYFYNKCIEPIARNIDIYALSLFIYQLFFNFVNITQSKNVFNIDYKKNTNIINILNKLITNALYNNIDGPDELINYLEDIINSIKTNKIIE